MIAEIFSGDIPFDSNEFKQMTIETFLDAIKDGNRPKIPAPFSNIDWIQQMVLQQQ